jgi:hypothetical protein
MKEKDLKEQYRLYKKRMILKGSDFLIVPYKRFKELLIEADKGGKNANN